MSESKKVVVYVGDVRYVSARVMDERRPVEFTAAELGSYTTYTGNTETRGVTETLYRTDDDRLIIYVENWSHWQGESSSYSLIETQETGLTLGGRFEMLGYAAGFGRPLSLDEGLSSKADTPQE